MKLLTQSPAFKFQIIKIVTGQLILLAVIGGLISYQVHLVENKITEMADLKDPSPFTARLVGNLNHITLNLLGYVHSQDKESLQGILQGESDFQDSVVEFQKVNPRMFPLEAQTKILNAYQPFKDAAGEILLAYTGQVRKWDDLLDNDDQILRMFSQRLTPIVRSGQQLANQRRDLISNMQLEVRSVPKDLTDYILKRGSQDDTLHLNDKKFESLLQIYEDIAPLRNERKVLDQIDGLWAANISLAQQILQLENAKSTAFSKMLAANRNLQTTISTVLPAVRPEVIEEKKSAIFHRITLILSAAALMALLGIGSCLLSGIYLYRRVRRYLDEIKVIAEAAATGDLSRQISTKGSELDGMGQSVNRLIGVLRRSEQLVYQLGNIVESSGDAAIGMNLEWAILSWNRGAQRMYGYTSDEIKGNFVDALFAPEHRHEVDILREKLQELKQVTFDTLHVRKSGVKIEIRLIASRILDTTGNVIGISLLARETPAGQRPLEARQPSSFKQNP